MIMPPNRTKNESFGVLYIAFGSPYLAMSIVSFLSLRKTNPDVPACIVTNVAKEPLDIPGWDKNKDYWIFLDEDTARNRLFKTAIQHHSPFDKTVYLDCDTLVVNDISLISFFLNYFDIAIKLNTGGSGRRDRNKKLFDGTRVFHELPHWNGGVIAFRKSASSVAFFECWNEKYKSLGFKRDQPSLIEAIFESKCRILSLNSRWNNADRLTLQGLYQKKNMREKTIIWHYKTDIDAKLRREIIKADEIIADSIGAAHCQETRKLLDKHSRLRPGAVFRDVVRLVRGRLADR
jgi:hypothetical protein